MIRYWLKKLMNIVRLMVFDVMKWFSVLNAVCLLSAGLLLSSGVSASGAHYYRYLNENGVKVISSRIPNRFVKNGYDIITIDGTLIERVAPEPSEEEKEKLRQEQAEQKRLELWDKELLRQYSRSADIEAAKQRKLAQNETSTSIIQRRIEKIDQDIIRYQGLAAADERAGKEVAIDTLHAIERLKKERAAAEQEVEEKQKERMSIKESHDKDLARFKVIRPDT